MFGRMYRWLEVLRRLEIIRRCKICVQICGAAVCCLWHQQYDKYDDDARKDGDKVKGPWPPQSMRHLTHYYGREEGTSEERKV